MEPIYSDHSRLDERSLALHRLVAEKVLADPALLDKARVNVRRWQESDGGPSFALAEWERILSGPADQVARFLVERSEKATRLRQSSPFTGILTQDERLAVYESNSTRTYYPGREPNLGGCRDRRDRQPSHPRARMKLPPIAFQSNETDVYPRNHPERADEIDAAIGELSPFHDTHRYYGHGVSPTTAIVPDGWEQRVVRLSHANTVA
jgi:hypothetical protein